VVNPGWADLDRRLFSISVAAELAGLHPQTLRIYEREGLLDPARSAGGTPGIPGVTSTGWPRSAR
jgi:MerR family regulatory protein